MRGWIEPVRCGRKAAPQQSQHPNSVRPDDCSPSQDWSVFKQIFAEHWDGFKRAYPRYDTRYYDGLVAKMLGCGDPDQMGYSEYPLSPVWGGHPSRGDEL